MYKQKTFSLMLLTTTIACSNEKKASWINPHLKSCELRLATNKQLPFSIAVNLNRTDASRYDSFYSTRAFTISKELQIKDLSTELLDSSKDGQIGVFVQYASDEQINVVKMWEDPINAMEEEQKKDFIFNPNFYRWDIHSIVNQEYRNITEDSDGFYNNGGVIYDNKISFTTIVNGKSIIYEMDKDGSNKTPITKNGFSYGMSYSANGRYYAYHSNYKLFIGDKLGGEKQVSTSCQFNFGPKWSPNSERVAFICDNDYFEVDKDGNNLKPLGSRNGLSLTIPFMKGYDFHGGGTDRYSWTEDSQYLVHSKNINNKATLVMSNGDDVKILTQDIDVSHPIVKDDHILFHGKNSTNKMYDLYMININSRELTQITNLEDNCNSRYALGF